jgi:hypothetical protein
LKKPYGSRSAVESPDCFDQPAFVVRGRLALAAARRSGDYVTAEQCTERLRLELDLARTAQRMRAASKRG